MPVTTERLSGSFHVWRTHTCLFHRRPNPEEDNVRLLDLNSHLSVQDLLLHRFHTAGRSASSWMKSIKAKDISVRSGNDSCFSPSGPEPAGIKRSKDTKSLSLTRPAPSIVWTWSVVMEVVVYHQAELLTYYPVCLMCPCRSQRKQPVMQMDLLRKSSGLSSRREEIESESDRERGRCSRIEELM